MATSILFYEPFDSNGFLSNFYPVIIDISGVNWPSSEHYYQAQKFNSQELQEKIRQAESPDVAFQLSRQYQDQVREDWMDTRVEVMKFIVNEKFTQHTQLAFHLVNTGDIDLKEHSHKDDFWGDGGDGHGSNVLGQILMEIRSSLKTQTPFNLVSFIDAAKLPTRWGEFKMHAFVEHSTQKEHIALVYGDINKVSAPLIRLHSECLTGDALFSARCDCGFQLSRALKNIVDEGAGVLLYLRQEGRGIGLSNKVRAYHLQDEGADTVQANERLGFAADMRDYAFCQGMLGYFGITSVRLMTNNPRKVNALEGANISVVERVAIQEGNNPHNHHYLKTKAEKLGHMFDATFIK
ncbi:GTP cyclohydrolase II [Vibrio lamellibrachiae]|uniref:GTP cyclohydrolase II n=1 Tax=Vibrio lamellibrachiae TaxID=2910253 RepID=UPI003D0CE53E